MNVGSASTYAGRTVRVRLWLALVGASALLLNCEALFGFRDLEVEPPDVGGFGGSHEGAGGVGGEAIGGAGLGGYPGGFGGEYLGGFGGEYFGGFGGFCEGSLPLGDPCTDDLECESCICEDSGDEAMPMRYCCLEICPPCSDCNPSTGLCEPVTQGADPPTCMSPDFCESGMCIGGC